MDMKLATARKSSRLAGHKSLAKLEKLNSLIYYDTFNWMKQKPGPRSKAKGHVSAIYKKNLQLPITSIEDISTWAYKLYFSKLNIV